MNEKISTPPARLGANFPNRFQFQQLREHFLYLGMLFDVACKNSSGEILVDGRFAVGLNGKRVFVTLYQADRLGLPEGFVQKGMAYAKGQFCAVASNALEYSRSVFDSDLILAREPAVIALQVPAWLSGITQKDVVVYLWRQTGQVSLRLDMPCLEAWEASDPENSRDREFDIVPIRAKDLAPLAGTTTRLIVDFTDRSAPILAVSDSADSIEAVQEQMANPRENLGYCYLFFPAGVKDSNLPARPMRLEGRLKSRMRLTDPCRSWYSRLHCPDPDGTYFPRGGSQ